MLVIYTSPGCASCRKAKQWLKDHEMPFTEKNIFSTILNEKEIRFLLERSENGTDDIISKRSKIIRDSNLDIEGMSINELVRFVQLNPSVLKRPIIMDERRFLVGYDDEEIGVFMPANLRTLQDSMCEDCPEYETCGKVREPA
ncbi:MAG: transcriptional regulator Spx [Erysipelotrichaceae bacterium]|nr:transcriptional regulator Spx [Erysipelotrichaceae bacterium]